MAAFLDDLRLELPPLSPAEALAAAAEGALLLDLREGEERARDGLYVEARAVPRGLLELALDPTRPEHDAVLSGAEAVVCLCSDGARAALAARTLRALGKEAHWMAGGVAAFAAAGGAVEGLAGDEEIGVTGVGGVFFKGREAGPLRDWYREVLGLAIDPSWGGLAFGWRQARDPSQPGSTTFSIFEDDSDYFGPGPGGGGQRFMVNLRVADLDAFLARLADHGVQPVGEVQDMDGFGRFAWIEDLEGHRVELWEPAPGL